MKNWQQITVVAIFGLFLMINIYTLNDGHNWGDDFAQYIQHSINLLGHQPYASNIALDTWVVPPPGFPLLLSPLIYVFGLNFKILKFLNVLLWAISAFAAYDLVLKRLGLFWARMVFVWFLTSPSFFFFKQNVLSDIPFMCFVLLSLWAFMKYEECQHKALGALSRGFLLLSIIFMSYSLLIRWAGISLLAAVIIYFLAVKKDWKRPVGFILGAAVSWAIALHSGSSVGGYFNKTTVTFQVWFLACLNNIAYVFQIILGFFISDKISLYKMVTPAADISMTIIFGMLILGLTGYFIYRLYQKKISFMGCFTYCYLMGVICCPFHGGTRYVLPIVIPVAVYVIMLIRPVSQKLAAFIFVFLILLNIYAIASDFKFNDDDIYQKQSLEMERWVGINIKPGEFYMFYKPRALGLLTHRLGATFWVHPIDEKEWYKRIRPLRIKYLIGDKVLDQFSRYDNIHLPVDQYQIYLNKLWENTRYKIFKVSESPPLFS